MEREKDTRDQQTKSANDQSKLDKDKSSQNPIEVDRRKDKGKQPQTPKSDKDPKNINEAFERLLDTRNDFLEKIDEANENVDENSTADQVNALRDARSDSLTKFQAQWVEFRRLIEAELARKG